jgi:hypothetical protein
VYSISRKISHSIKAHNSNFLSVIFDFHHLLQIHSFVPRASSFFKNIMTSIIYQSSQSLPVADSSEATGVLGLVLRQQCQVTSKKEGSAYSIPIRRSLPRFDIPKPCGKTALSDQATKDIAWIEEIVMAIRPSHNWAAQQQDQQDVEVQLEQLSGGQDEDDFEVPLKEEGRRVSTSKEASSYRRDLLLANEANFMMAPADLFGDDDDDDLTCVSEDDIDDEPSEIDVTESLKGHHCHALHNYDGDASMLVTRSLKEGSPYRVEMLLDNMGNFSPTLIEEWDDDHTCVSEADIDDESSEADFVDALKDHNCLRYDGDSSMFVAGSSKEGSTYRMDILLDNMKSFSKAVPVESDDELTCVSEGDIDDDESECLNDEF